MKAVFLVLFLSITLGDLQSDLSNYVTAVNSLVDSTGRQVNPTESTVSGATASAMETGGLFILQLFQMFFFLKILLTLSFPYPYPFSFTFFLIKLIYFSLLLASAADQLRNFYTNVPTKEKNFVQLDAASQMALTEQKSQMSQLNARMTALSKARQEAAARYATSPKPDSRALEKKSKANMKKYDNAASAVADDTSSYQNMINQVNQYNSGEGQDYASLNSAMRTQRRELESLIPSAYTSEESDVFNALAARLKKQ
jgi:hypothetical protein